MNEHINNLIFYIPGFLERSILDIGSGGGEFVIKISKHGSKVIGLEPFAEYVRQSRKKIREEDVLAEIIQSSGEKMPFIDNQFDFINMRKVIEHTEKPDLVLKEAYRVLSPQGMMYLNVPNRHGLKDPNFSLFFVNWLPRRFADAYISMFGRHKNMRLIKIENKIKNRYIQSFIIRLYKFARRFLYNDFEFLLSKDSPV